MALPRTSSDRQASVVMQCADRGHAILPHTADAVIEAWGPTAAACYEEAAAGFVEVFVANHTGEATVRPFDVGPGRPEDLLVLLLEEILFDADTQGLITVGAEVEVRDDHLVGRLATVPSADVEVSGSIPKGISYSDLSFGHSESGWRCRATVDV